jgi:putative peptide zinc metalloprotease protein
VHAEDLHVSDRAPATDAPPPRLADGIELIGEFEDSGFKRPPFIARRRDGQVVQMHQMLYRLAEQIDGHAKLEEVAERFSTAIERNVKAADVQMLIDQQLRPLGIVAPPNRADVVELGKVDPLLALKFRAAVVPDSAVRSLTTIFRPLFRPSVVLLVVLAMAALDGWLFFVHGISQSVRHTLYDPALMLMLIAGVIVATAFHEIGHATACRYGGARPGVMGVGIYIVWPAFYTDITDAYRLGKRGRLRADLGGMYFNAVFALIVAAAYALTSFEPLLLLIVLQNFTILQQALPLLRLDGYYILSDLTGVPDIFMRIRPVLGSLIPGRNPDPRVTELKSWVRTAVTFYILLIVAFLGVTVLAMVINLPRIVATGYDSAALRFQAIGPGFSHGQTATALLDVIQMLFLALPAAGVVYTAARIGRRMAAGALKWSAGQPARQTALATAGAAAAVVAAFSWLPNGQYQPVQPAEHGTVPGLFAEVAALPTGRPSLTVQRQQQLGGAPTLRQLDPKRRRANSTVQGGQNAPAGASRPAGTPTTNTTTTAPAGATTTPAGSTTPTGSPQRSGSTSTSPTGSSASPASPTAGASGGPAATSPATTTTATTTTSTTTTTTTTTP